MTNGDCVATAVVERSDFKHLTEQLMTEERAPAIRDALHIDRQGRSAFIFSCAVVVTWQWAFEERTALLKRLNTFGVRPHQNAEIERFLLSVEAEQFRIHRDHLFSKDASPLHLLAVSHALAQPSCTRPPTVFNPVMDRPEVLR